VTRASGVTRASVVTAHRPEWVAGKHSRYDYDLESAIDVALVREIRNMRRVSLFRTAALVLRPDTLLMYRRLRLPGADERLGAVLRHAVARVPFYRESINAADVSDPSLPDFPILEKQTLQNEFANLILRDEAETVAHGTFYLARTSGSTGEPTTHLKLLLQDGLSDSVVINRILRRERVPRRGDIYDLGPHTLGWPLHDLMIWPPRVYRSWVIRGSWTREVASQLMAVVLAVRHPVFMFGFPSRLSDLAQSCLETGISRRPRVVLCLGEQMTTTTRTFLSDVFQCPVRSIYNTAELGMCGWECSSGHIHFDSDIAVPEVVDSDGRACAPGEVGQLLVTSLTSWVMPLIRYNTGDLAVAADKCTCGAGSPSIAALEGRAKVLIYTRSGRRFQGYRLLSHVRDELHLRDFQVIQRYPGRFLVMTGRDGEPNSQDVSRLRERVEEWLGEATDVDVEKTGRFIVTRTGKRNPLVQFIEADFHESVQ
jgi:phenylacetate-coenzyme A ligase PaaK-like adenylate-forming protein